MCFSGPVGFVEGLSVVITQLIWRFLNLQLSRCTAILIANFGIASGDVLGLEAFRSRTVIGLWSGMIGSGEWDEV